MNERIQNSEVLPLVRSLVRERLLNSDSFKQLSAERRRQVAPSHRRNQQSLGLTGQSG